MTHQITNFHKFVECVVEGSEGNLNHITHHTRSRTPLLDNVCYQWRERGVLIDVKIDPSPHVREMSFSNGIIITSDRGIDIYRAPVRKGQWRTTHRALVEVKKFEHEQLTHDSPSPVVFYRRRFRPRSTNMNMELCQMMHPCLKSCAWRSKSHHS